MKLTFSMKEKDLGFEALKKRVLQLKASPAIKVGVVGEKASEDHGGISLGELAMVHEFGSPKAHIPERSFLRSTFEAQRAKVTQTLGKDLALHVEGRSSMKQSLAELGEELVEAVKNRMRGGISPALASGESRPPLIDTEKLLDAIGYELSYEKGG